MRLAIGTAAFGPYAGFAALTRRQSLELLLDAHACGVRLYDTSPGYGDAEELVGMALGDKTDSMLMTKLPRYGQRGGRGTYALDEIDRSRKALRRDQLDLLQLHNASVDDLMNGALLDALRERQAKGDLLALGATVYTVDEAKAAVAAGLEAIQVPYNILDRRMAQVFGRATAAGVTVYVRSVWLRGALASELVQVPLAARMIVNDAKTWLGATWKALPAIALRYAIQPTAVRAAVVGVRTLAELHAAIAAAEAGPLPLWRRLLAAGWRQPPPDVWDVRLWDQGDQTRAVRAARYHLDDDDDDSAA